MTHTDRINLADSYMAAWLVVKRRPCVVNVDSQGWFTVTYDSYSLRKKCRASDLLRGLAELTARIVENNQQGKS